MCCVSDRSGKSKDPGPIRHSQMLLIILCKYLHVKREECQAFLITLLNMQENTKINVLLPHHSVTTALLYKESGS